MGGREAEALRPRREWTHSLLTLLGTGAEGLAGLVRSAQDIRMTQNKKKNAKKRNFRDTDADEAPGVLYLER